MQIFCKRLKQLREERKLTQKTVAESIRVAERHYQSMEYGQTKPGLDILIALADYFGVSIDYLAGRTDNPEVNI